MGTKSHWLGRLVRAGIAAALLVPWHGQAEAACDSDVVEAMVLAMEAPATEHTAPCCVASPSSPIAAEKLRADVEPLARVAIGARAGFDECAARPSDPQLPDSPWRPYCARCARLLL